MKTRDEQKILIISDTHLTDKFDKKKFEFLNNIIQDSDKVIINGDFWDNWYTNFDKFLDSKWSGLFPLLLSKKAVYIHGNHDPKESCDKRTSKFSIESCENFLLTLDGEHYYFEHGHEILKLHTGFLLHIYGNIINFLKKYHGKFILHIIGLLELFGFKLFGDRLMFYSDFARNRNNKLKRKEVSEWLICGDTHSPEVDRKLRFANSGSINHGYASYLLIKNNNVALETRRY